MQPAGWPPVRSHARPRRGTADWDGPSQLRACDLMKTLEPPRRISFTDVERLAESVRAALPRSKALTRLEPVPASGYVLLTWSEQNFAVKLSGEAFELKGKELFVTGASRLISSSIMLKQRTDSVLAAVIDTLAKAESLVASDQKDALELLDSVKNPIRRLVAY